MAVIRTPSVKVGFKVADNVLERDVVARTLDERDYDLLLNPGGGPVLVYMPDNRPLACYLPGVLKDVMEEVDAYRILHPLHRSMSNNRGMASGTKRIERGAGGGTRSDAMNVSSVILGAFEQSGVYRYCRMTEWTGRNLPEWQTLAPLFRVIARHLEERVTERYNIQMDMARKTDAGWVVPGTPFTSITVNNSYPTGVHKDDGDLEDGFSTIACIRRGDYEGGRLVFPQYRVAVDLQDGDLLLMDAHQWHGNTRMTCSCGERIQNKFCSFCGAERISIVSYYRTRMADCGSPEEEYERAVENTEKRSQPRKKIEPDEEPAVELITAPVTVLPDPEPPQNDNPPAEPEKPKRPSRARTAAKIAVAELTKPAPEPEVKKTVRARKAAQAPAPVAETTSAPVKATRSRARRAAPVKKVIAVDPVTGEPLEV
jgi:hypothetical protein